MPKGTVHFLEAYILLHADLTHRYFLAFSELDLKIRCFHHWYLLSQLLPRFLRHGEESAAAGEFHDRSIRTIHNQRQGCSIVYDPFWNQGECTKYWNATTCKHILFRNISIHASACDASFSVSHVFWSSNYTVYLTCWNNALVSAHDNSDILVLDWHIFHKTSCQVIVSCIDSTNYISDLNRSRKSTWLYS